LANRVQCSGVRARSTLMATGQGVNVLGEGATRARGVQALEAAHLDFKDDLSIEHGALGQAADIRSMQAATPASAVGARCGAHRTSGFHRDRAFPVVAADHALAHSRENSVHRVDKYRHDAAHVGA
jgi:hypothetical protein